MIPADQVQHAVGLLRVFDRIFDLTFFVGCPDSASMRVDTEGAHKLKERFIETDYRANPLGNSGEHIVYDDFFSGSTEVTERLQQSPMQSALILTMGEVNVEHTAVSLNNRESIQFPAIVSVADTWKVSPVYLDLLSRFRFETNEWLAGFSVSAAFTCSVFA